jgi:hypothetical protein
MKENDTNGDSSFFHLECSDKKIKYRIAYNSLKDFVLLPQKSLQINMRIKKEKILATTEQMINDEVLIKYMADNCGIYSRVQKTVPLAFTLEPKIIWTSQSLNLGMVKQGYSIKATYFYYNNSPDEIFPKIKFPDYVKVIHFIEKISPYSKDSIQIEIDTKNLCDYFKGYISFLLSDKMEYTLIFYLHTTDIHNFAFMEFESEQQCLQNIKGKQQVKYYFEFKNTGTIPLIINRCQNSGASVANWSKEPVLPGKTGIIEIIYYATVSGDFGKTCTVLTNDRFRSAIILKIAGNVIE